MLKKLLYIMLVSFVSIAAFGQPREVILHTGSAVSLKNAIEGLKGSGIIHIKGELFLNTRVTVPVGIKLKFNEYGRFTLNHTANLIIEGRLEAGLHQIFNKKVRFSDKAFSEIQSEWFGIGAHAVNSALLSADEIPVRINKNVRIKNTIIMNSNQTLLINDGIELIVANDMQGAAVLVNKNRYDANITINGGMINGTEADSVAYDGILFNGVRNSSIVNLSCLNVHTTASRDTGNIRLNNCTNVLLENCNVSGTWKMGIFILNGMCNYVKGGTFYGTHDSAIGVVNSHGTTIDGLYVDNCGTSDGSNMSLNAEGLLVINNTSINASGTRNGNGITLGHDASPASYSVCSDNFIFNNRAKGIFIQGKNTKNVVVTANKVIQNGIGSQGTNSGGIAVYAGTRGHLIFKNQIIRNRIGVSLHNTSQDVLIMNNQIRLSTLVGIRNDGKNITVRDNALFNTKNIRNGFNSWNLIFKGNNTNEP